MSNPALGLCVFTDAEIAGPPDDADGAVGGVGGSGGSGGGGSGGSGGVGGIGVPPTDVVTLLKGLQPRPRAGADDALERAAAPGGAGGADALDDAADDLDGADALGAAPPLATGTALAIVK